MVDVIYLCQIIPKPTLSFFYFDFLSCHVQMRMDMRLIELA